MSVLDKKLLIRVKVRHVLRVKLCEVKILSWVYFLKKIKSFGIKLSN